MDIICRDRVVINGSEVWIDIISGIDFEDIVTFRAKARLHERQNGIEGVVRPTSKSVRDWLVKGE